LLKEHGDKVGADKKSAVEKALEKLRTALKDGRQDDIKAKLESLNTQMQELSQELYSKAGPHAQGGDGKADPEQAAGASAGGAKAAPDSPKGGKEEDVIDADFEMVDEDRK